MRRKKAASMILSLIVPSVVARSVTGFCVSAMNATLGFLIFRVAVLRQNSGTFRLGSKDWKKILLLTMFDSHVVFSSDTI